MASGMAVALPRSPVPVLSWISPADPAVPAASHYQLLELVQIYHAFIDSQSESMKKLQREVTEARERARRAEIKVNLRDDEVKQLKARVTEMSLRDTVFLQRAFALQTDEEQAQRFINTYFETLQPAA